MSYDHHLLNWQAAQEPEPYRSRLLGLLAVCAGNPPDDQSYLPPHLRDDAPEWIGNLAAVAVLAVVSVPFLYAIVKLIGMALE